MIFLHGWGGDASAFLFVAKRIKCTATLVDFYGFGKSPHPDYPLTVKDYARGVLEIMEAEGIKSATLVGHSFGGRVALEIAANYPEKVKKLVLVDSAGIRPKHGFKYQYRIIKHKLLKYFRGYGLSGSSDFQALSPVMKGTFINVVNYDQTYLLKKIKAETAIFWGVDDKVTPLSMARKLNGKISGSQLFLLTNAGHFSYLDSSEKFLLILAAFLDD